MIGRAGSVAVCEPPRSGLGRWSRAVLFATALAACILSDRAWAAETREISVKALLDMPLEELMDTPVTSVAGVKQDWFDSPAALYVVTAEDLRRTGHRTLADVLRLVPGVFVGNSDAHSWSVGARGFSSGLANKTLVLIDGRAVYDPLFGGTFWDVPDILLDDLDRIEVIRGPGATLWGANAVNGVINVISRKARDTQGTSIKAGGGSEERGFTAARHGGKIGEKTWYRGWGKYFNRDDFGLRGGGSNNDKWDLGHGGFRLDHELDDQTMVSVQGGGYGVRFNETTNVAVEGAHREFVIDRGHGRADGANAMARVTRENVGKSGWSLQAYYDWTDRRQTALEVERNTANLDWRHHFRIGDRNELLWGVGYRYTGDKSDPSSVIEFNPRDESFQTVSGFVQDTVTLVPDRLFAMLGSKLEYNTFTGFEIQPSGRVWWTPHDDHIVWGSISRPVRVPTRIELNSTITLGYVDTGLIVAEPPTGVVIPLRVLGDDDLESEKMLAYELGYRIRITPEITLDAAVFYNDYSTLIFVPPTTFGTFTDAGSGETYGGELTGYWRALDRWALEASYSFVEVEIHGPVLSSDQAGSPNHQVKARSYLNVTDTIELNTTLYYVDRVPSLDVDSYVRFDQGITWQATPEIALSLWGQNLFDKSHREASRTVEVDRAFYLAATFEF